jgi:predicted ester cyclase
VQVRVQAQTQAQHRQQRFERILVHPMTLQGFDTEFHDLDHYIRVITDRIWEGRAIHDIERYYSADCAVETPSSVSIGTGPVIEGTRATLAAFPDRRLLAEDVIISGDAVGGFLSSHRIFSPMSHAGPGAFGPPSHRPVHARTIADCVCINNRIVHEWLVRDQAAIARQIGLHERDLAQRWLQERGGFAKPAMPPAPPPYQSFVDTHPLAQRYAAGLMALWERGVSTARGVGLAGPAGLGVAASAIEAARSQCHAILLATHHLGAISALPGGELAVGREALARFWAGLSSALALTQWTIEHLVLQERPGRAAALTVRWRAQTLHQGAGRYGAASGNAVEVLGITHAEFENEQVVREWHLIDDVALWMQVLQT